MTRSFLTRMLGAAAALMMALSVFAGCRVYTGWRTVRLSGNVQETTVYGSGVSDGWTVELEKLSFSDSENAVIRLVPSDSVRVEAKYSGDFADYGFEITAKNGKIRIGTNHNYNYIADVFEITVYADFNHVELSGGCSLEIDASGVEELRLDISGACDCLVENAAAKRLEIELSGAANIDISGTVQTFVAGLSGAADVAAKSLVAAEADIRVSGAGSVILSVTDTLKTKISGVGSVYYYGSPVVTSNVSGLGEVKQRSEEIYME